MVTSIRHYIDGKEVSGAGTRTSPVFNLAIGEETGSLCIASAGDVVDAVASAAKAASGWAETTPLRRARVLNRFLRILEERTDELAHVHHAAHENCFIANSVKTNVTVAER